MTAPAQAEQPVAELLPCPFCGGAAEVRPDEVGSGGQHVPPYHAGCCSCRVYFTEEESADAIAARNRRPSAWVDAGERLPEEWQYVLAYWADGLIARGCWYSRGGGERGWTREGTSGAESHFPHLKFTHWQPLPPPPSAGRGRG